MKKSKAGESPTFIQFISISFVSISSSPFHFHLCLLIYFYLYLREKKSTILCETFFYTVLFPFCRVLTDVCLIILECTVPSKCRLALLFLGSIVFQGSISSFLGQPNCATYATMKGAIVQLARNCAYDFAKYGIRVNTVCAGTVETPISVHERAEQGW